MPRWNKKHDKASLETPITRTSPEDDSGYKGYGSTPRYSVELAFEIPTFLLGRYYRTHSGGSCKKKLRFTPGIFTAFESTSSEEKSGGGLGLSWHQMVEDIREGVEDFVPYIVTLVLFSSIIFMVYLGNMDRGNMK